MDLQMGDLLKNMRSSQIFSVCGLPDVKVAKVQTQNPKPKSKIRDGRRTQWQAELLGLDTFDPVTMEADHLKPRRGARVAAGHGLQRDGVPRAAGVFPAHRAHGRI